MKQLFARRWFLFVLVAVIVVGFSFPVELESLAESLPRRTIVAAVLFLMALPLKISSMWESLRRPLPVLLAVAVNFGVVPLLALAVTQLLPTTVLPPELSVGLLVMSAIPSTLASAAVWTRRAGGNDAVSILVTLVTNLSCFLVTPLWLLVLTGAAAEIDAAEMIGNLGLLVVTPMVLAQLLRFWRPIASWSSARKIPLGVLAQVGILMMVLIGVVRCGVRLSGPEASPSPMVWAALVVVVASVHLFALWLGHALGRAFGAPREDRIAIGFSGSQKTLMVGLHIVVTYFANLPLAILPLVVYHVSQLLLDTLIADRLRERGKAASQNLQSDTDPRPTSRPLSE